MLFYNIFNIHSYPRKGKLFNYLFAGSHEAAQRAAMMYSFFATCKINNIEPSEWMFKMFTRIPDHSIQRLEELLPQNLK